MTPSLPPEGLTELERLAKAATPGPWGRVGVPYYEYWIVRADEVEGVGHKHAIATIAADNCREGSYYVNFQRDRNAAYIAAANPETMLRLLATISERDAALAVVVGAVQTAFGRIDEAMGDTDPQDENDPLLLASQALAPFCGDDPQITAATKAHLEMVEGLRARLVAEENAHVATTIEREMFKRSLADTCARERALQGERDHANAARMEQFSRATTAESERDALAKADGYLRRVMKAAAPALTLFDAPELFATQIDNFIAGLTQSQRTAGAVESCPACEKSDEDLTARLAEDCKRSDCPCRRPTSPVTVSES